MALHVVVWTTLWTLKGESAYAFLAGFSAASLTFMIAWVELDCRRR